MSAGALPELDRTVRLHVFRRTAEAGNIPRPEEVAAALGQPLDAIEASLQRLAAGRVLVLAPGSSAIWMANPFSAVPTDFRVTVRDRTYFGNCVWDALGIPAILHADGIIETVCGDCSAPMGLGVRNGQLEDHTGIVHFAVPAREWWVNIGFT